MALFLVVHSTYLYVFLIKSNFSFFIEVIQILVLPNYQGIFCFVKFFCFVFSELIDSLSCLFNKCICLFFFKKQQFLVHLIILNPSLVMISLTNYHLFCDSFLFCFLGSDLFFIMFGLISLSFSLSLSLLFVHFVEYILHCYQLLFFLMSFIIKKTSTLLYHLVV